VARTAAIDAEVLATLAEDVLRPTVINQAIALALDEFAPAGADRVRRTLEAELTKVTCFHFTDQSSWLALALDTLFGASLRDNRGDSRDPPATLSASHREADDDQCP
jgi:hypothetical protein